MSDSHEVSRRDFVRIVTAFLGTVIGAVVGLPAIGYLIAPAAKGQESEGWVPLGKVEDFPVESPVLRTFVRTKINGWEKTSNSYGVYVMRHEGDQFTILSNACTHLSCRVSWNEERQAYLCPCHDAVFAKDGSVLSGPPPKALKSYNPEGGGNEEDGEYKVEEGILSIFFKEG
jgi:Rieske Fe-S protein